MKIHGAITDKQIALVVMRLHNKTNKENRCFLIKSKIAIAYSDTEKNGFLIATFK